MDAKNIINKVCRLLGNVTPSDIMSRKRDYRTATARQLVMWYMVRILGFSANKTGEMLGRTHVTVIFGLQQIENIIYLHRDYDRKILNAVEILKRDTNGL